MRGGCGRALIEKFISSSEMSSICFNFQDLFLQSSVLIFSYFFQRVLFIFILAFSTEFCFYFREFCLFSREFYLYFFWLFLQSSVSLSWARSGYQSNRRRQLQRFGVDSFSAVTICQRRQTLILRQSYNYTLSLSRYPLFTLPTFSSQIQALEKADLSTVSLYFF